MKILLVGQFKNWALENHYAKYLGQAAEVASYAAEDIFDDHYRASVFNKIRFKLGLSGIYQTIAKGLMERVAAEKPDVVWVFKGMRVLPKTLSDLRKMGIKTANYNPDHPFLFSTNGSGNQNVTDAIGLYDLHFCYSRSVQQRIEQEFGIKTAFLPFAYELSQADFDLVEREAQAEIPAACFIGNPDPIRVAHLEALVKAGLPVHVYGYDWDKHLTPSAGLHIHPVVLGLDFWRTMRSYRLQVNVFRPHNEGSHNMRTFEVPAVGGIMLAPDSPEHRDFFAVGQEVFTYQNLGELVEKAKYVIGMPASEAAGFRLRARERSVQSGYSYADRAKQAVAALNSILY